MNIHTLQEVGEEARQRLGIDGTMGDAQDIPHGYDDGLDSVACCIICGLSRTARVHHKPIPVEG